jgi:hypothetical protein
MNENQLLSANKDTALCHWREITYCSSWVKNPNGLDSWPFKMGPTSCPEMLVRNYHYTLLNIPEEPRSRKWVFLLYGGKLTFSFLSFLKRRILYFSTSIMCVRVWVSECVPSCVKLQFSN